MRGTLEDRIGMQKYDLLHFIPAIVHFINLTPYFLQPFAYKLGVAESLIQDLDNLKNLDGLLIYPTSVGYLFRTLTLLAYTLFIFYKLLIDYTPIKQNFNHIPLRQYLITYRWLFILNIIVFTVALEFFLLIISFLNVKSSTDILNASPTYLYALIAFTVMPLSLLLFPQVMYGIPIYTGEPELSNKVSVKKKNTSKVLNKDTPESQDPFLKLSQEIISFLDKEKPYLHPEFNISDLSIALKVPHHHISYCFNSVLKIKFTTLKNQLRVAYAKELLTNGASSELSIEGISKEAGFASPSNFYAAFKSETGLTPSEFLTQLNK